MLTYYYNTEWGNTKIEYLGRSSLLLRYGYKMWNKGKKILRYDWIIFKIKYWYDIMLLFYSLRVLLFQLEKYHIN